MHSLRMLCCLTIATVAMFVASPAHSATPVDRSITKSELHSLQPLEYPMALDHTSSNVVFTITNYGMFGAFQDIYPMEPVVFHPGCEYPKGSGILHCYQGALWVGAVVGNDTLVSVGADGWQHVFEMYPDSDPGGITRLSNRQDDPDFDSSAVADEEFVAVYFDTLSDPALTGIDLFENRVHIPLGLKIRQHSYSFGGPPDDDFILLRYTVTNIGNNHLNNVYVAAYLDTDVWHPTTSYGFTDDFAGSRWVVTSDGNDSLLVGYAADDDGDPSHEDDDGDPSHELVWNQYSARSVFSATFIDVPDEANLGFNWWFSLGEPDYDWGPRLLSHDRPFGTGGQGTPEGDRNKYYVMSHPEIDYNQLWTYVDMTEHGWNPPYHGVPLMEIEYYDTRFLISFGGFDLAPGDSSHFGMAIVLGENIHQNPNDFDNLIDDKQPQEFYNTLDFSDLDSNVIQASRVYNHLFYGMTGDVNNSGEVTLTDVVGLVDFLFLQGATPRFRNAADVNGDCKVDLKDVLGLLRFLYRGGPLVRAGCVE